MSKKVLKGKEARERLKKGVALLAEAVATTMSAAGKNCIIDTVDDAPYITGDGITVSEAFELETPFEQIGVQLVKNVCRQANMTAGDGSTSSIVLANAMLQNDNIIEGCTFPRVSKGMKNAVDDVIDILKKNSKQIETKEDLINIATISARGDREMGVLIAEAYEHIGEEGTIMVEEARDNKSYIEKLTGYQIDKGCFHQKYFTNHTRGISEHNDPLILLTDIPMVDIYSQATALTIAYNQNQPLIIICPEMSKDCDDSFYQNIEKTPLTGVFIETPDFGVQQESIMTDLAYLLNAKFFSEQRGHTLDDIKALTIEDLGTCDKLKADKSRTVFIGFEKTKEEVDKYISEIYKDDDNLPFYTKRTGRLKGRLAKLFVGARSHVEMNEKRDRVDDACNATKAALQEGYVVGGGIALFNAAKQLKIAKGETADERKGYALIINSITVPARQILFNLYEDKKEVDIILDKINLNSSISYGYDVKELEYVDLIEKGIIDPLKVTKSALESAYSVVSTILSTDCIISIVGDNGELKL